MDLLAIIRSMRKSALRVRTMRRMLERKRAYPALLAEDLDISLRDLRRVLYGELPKYSPALSPIRLGLLRQHKVGRRVELRITPLGEQVARELPRMLGRRVGGSGGGS